MQKSLRNLFFVALVLVPACLSAKTFEASGFLCTVNADNATVSVGALHNAGYPADLSIPDYVLDGNTRYNVTGISKEGFWKRSDIETLTLSDNVTEIGANAFSSCSQLTTIKRARSVKRLGNAAFAVSRKLESVYFPAVETIGDQAFWHCTALERVNMPELVVIGSNAFMECEKLTEIIMPKLATVGSGAFVKCEALTTALNFNNRITIGNYAYNYCFGISVVQLPYEVYGLGEGSFYNCQGLKTLFLLNDNFGELHEANHNGLLARPQQCTIYCAPAIYDYLKENYTGKIVNLNDVLIPTFISESDGSFKVSFKPSGNYTFTSGLTVRDSDGNKIDPVESVYTVRGDKALVSYSVTGRTLTYYVHKPVAGAIASVEAEAEPRQAIGTFDLSGHRISDDAEGIVIVRYSDGSSEKIIR